MKRVIESCGCLWLFRALSSSIGQKVVMAITGLALCGFLVAHLGGNLLMYAGASKYDHYAHSLHAQTELLLVAEIGLLLMFVLHIWLAFKTNSDNTTARPTVYAMRQSKLEQGPLAQPASAVMLVTGVVVLGFLLVHLSDFKFFDWRHQVAKGLPQPEPFLKAVIILRDPISALVYFVGSLVLGYHVLHGVESAFQTLGLNHPKYTPIVKFISLVFAVIVAVGFGSFPLWAWAFKT